MQVVFYKPNNGLIDYYQNLRNIYLAYNCIYFNNNWVLASQRLRTFR